MLDILYAAERVLPRLLAERKAWKSLRVDYHPPFVDRLWRQWDAYRIMLHRIHPCDPAEALFHPHWWPSAVRLLDGTYLMRVGFGNPFVGPHDPLPPVALEEIISAPTAYTMPDPYSWHSVVPLDGYSHSLMVIGPKYATQPRNVVKYPLNPLWQSYENKLFDFFGERFPTREALQKDAERFGYGHRD